jgi:uncharacterized protein with PIN domain
VSEAIVLDASAVVAILNAEPGHAEAVTALPNAAVGAVNLSEVVAKLAERGMPTAEAFRDALTLGQQRRALVLTTERAWLTVSDAIGVRVRNIRPADRLNSRRQLRAVARATRLPFARPRAAHIPHPAPITAARSTPVRTPIPSRR